MRRIFLSLRSSGLLCRSSPLPTRESGIHTEMCIQPQGHTYVNTVSPLLSLYDLTWFLQVSASSIMDERPVSCQWKDGKYVKDVRGKIADTFDSARLLCTEGLNYTSQLSSSTSATSMFFSSAHLLRHPDVRACSVPFLFPLLFEPRFVRVQR